MGPVGWRKAMRLLGCDALRVVLAYALVLQILAPVAFARAASGEPLVMRHSLCSALLPGDIDRQGKAPQQAAHACLFCCLSAAAGILPPPVELAAPLRVSLATRLTTAAVVVDVVPGPGTPPQRAPPGLV